MRIVDLSKPIVDNSNDPFFMRIRIRHKRHALARWLVRALGLPFRLMPADFEGWADDTITRMGVHAATHIDAPWHYATTSAGRPAETIEQLGLEKCFGPGVVLDMSHKADGEAITQGDLAAELDRTGAQLAPGTIALIRTGRDKHLGARDYWKRGTGMTAEATRWIIDQGVEVMGIDQWGWDLPFHVMIERAKATGNRELFWEAHRVGRERRFWHMEQLCNLDRLPAMGFRVGVFPLPLAGCSAAPARVVAFIPETLEEQARASP